MLLKSVMLFMEQYKKFKLIHTFIKNVVLFLRNRGSTVKRLALAGISFTKLHPLK